MLGRSAVVPVRVPRAERLAWHKVIVSQTRNETSDKKAKDREQAAVLMAVLAEREPAALEEAFADLSTTARVKAKRGASVMLGRLAETGHGRAEELLRDLLG